MEDSEFLWKAISVALVVGNLLQAWINIRKSGKPTKVDVNDQPVEVVEGDKPASMDKIKVLHHRLDEHGRRLATLEAARETDKQNIVDEIVKMREQNQNNFAALNRAIGRLEGVRIQN